MKIRLKWKGKSASGAAPTRANFCERAYTLVEVMVAGTILGLVAMSLYGAFSAGFCVIQSTRENLRATQIMVQKMEAVRLFTWSQVNDSTNYLKPVFTEPYDPLGMTNNCSGAQYTGYVSASIPAAGDLPEAYRTNMRTITVSLYWTNFNGKKPVVHAREMQTRVARNGMQNYIWGAL
jgi:type II secretory pathway pseudopilin PulG